ncbi:MAG: tetratricopeptide repeat protein [Planctomycetes bacterium]|nr:tetratricopeptide repeat protein [Planctomycetota bacterium]
MSEKHKEVLRQVQTLEEAEQIDQAIQLVTDNLKKLKPHVYLHFKLGHLYYSTDRLENAKKSYQKAIEIMPEYLPAHKNLGIIYYHDGEHKKALSHLSASLPSLTPKENDLLVLASCQKNLGLDASAVRTLEWGLSLFPLNMNIRELLIESYTILEHYDKARDVILESLKLEGEKYNLWLGLSSTYLNEGQALKGIQALEVAYLLRPENHLLALQLGDLYYNENMLEDALSYYIKAKEHKPLSLPLRRMARAYLAMGENEKALSELNKITERTSETKLMEAEIYQNLDKHEEALNLLKQLQQKNDTQGRMSYLAGLSAYSLNLFQEAEDFFNRARNYPHYRIVSLKYLIIIATKKGQQTEAASLAHEALKWAPDDKWFLKMLGGKD